MPDFTAEQPHAITCIGRSIKDLLVAKSGADLTFSCDRDDCWADEELFKHRQAVNIVTGSDSILSPVKSPRKNKGLVDIHKPDDFQCWYDAVLDVELRTYVAQCDCDDDDECCLDAKGKAYSILGHMTSTLISNQSQVLGRRILYKGSSPFKDSDNDVEIVAVTGRFEVHYLFDPTRPYVVQQ